MTTDQARQALLEEVECRWIELRRELDDPRTGPETVAVSIYTDRLVKGLELLKAFDKAMEVLE